MAIQTGLRIIVVLSPKMLFWLRWISCANRLSLGQIRWHSTATVEGPLWQAWWRQKTRRWQPLYSGQETTIFLACIRPPCAASTLTSDRRRVLQLKLLELGLPYMM